MTTKVRDNRIDFVKGILMWGVIYGHTINALTSGVQHDGVILHTFIRIYDMPFFMFLSGFFMRKSLGKHGVKYQLVNRTSMILLPILIWTLPRLHFSYHDYYFLWAVYASSIVCIFTSFLTKKISQDKLRNIFELFTLIVVVVTLHLFYVPWNLFYLLPFFIVGYYVKRLDFAFPIKKLPSLVFIIGLCFWSTRYTPWEIDALSWEQHPVNIIIYAYRFLLGILGIYIMGGILTKVYEISKNGGGIITLCGKETLALYLLQGIVIERILNRIINYTETWLKISTYPQVFLNLLGYVFAPVISFIVMVALYRCIIWMKNHHFTKKLFGFKLLEQ